MTKTNVSQTQTVHPPVVAVLGHVDHGKTTLLDAIRKTSIAQREHGGITQSIGASKVTITHEGKKRDITFIDTPGHEAFSHMRSRGAQAADIGLLIISSVDGVMPQTKESISLLANSGIPFIVVLTKSDDQNKNPEKVKQQLLKENVLLEGYGGNIPVIEVSAKTGTNIKELLELILLVEEMKEKKELVPNEKLSAIVIESRLDKHVGPKATVVIKNGTLRLRDDIVCEHIEARVRTMISGDGKQVTQASIGEAVEVLGFPVVPSVGAIVKKKNEGATVVQKEKREIQSPPEFSFVIEKDDTLSIILCTDTLGSLEAITHAFPEKVKIVFSKVGDIAPAEILLAKSVKAIVLGFNTKVSTLVQQLATTEKVPVKNYTIIYEMLDEMRDVLEGKRLALVEEILGKAKILASFPFDKKTVLGIAIIEGRVAKGDKIRILRGDTIVGESTIISLRQGKNQLSKVEAGNEAGIILNHTLDFTIGDMVLCHG